MKIETVSKRYQIPASTLRYYERQGLLGPIQRVSGIRNFNQADLERLDFIICVKQCGMTIKQMREFIGMYREGNATIDDRLTILQDQLAASKVQQAQLAESIEHLKTKIADVKVLQNQLSVH